MFDASGNRVIVADARNVSLAPSHLAVGLMQSSLHALFSHTPEMYVVLSQTSGGVWADFWNPDSTREHVCGNALRCIPFVMHVSNRDGSCIDRIIINTPHAAFETYKTGERRSRVEFQLKRISIKFYDNGDALINPGTPHHVRFVSDLRSRNISRLGERWSRSSNPVNATFVKISNNLLGARTLGRGVGETRSCGTGAVAAFLAYRYNPQLTVRDSQMNIQFDSGEQLVVVLEKGGTILSMEGNCYLLSALTI